MFLIIVFSTDGKGKLVPFHTIHLEWRYSVIIMLALSGNFWGLRIWSISLCGSFVRGAPFWGFGRI
jgi:hypothetical protein